MNFFPNHTHDFRRDYKTNAPSYYDYLAEQQEALTAVWSEIETILNGDIVTSIESGDTNLIKLEKEEETKHRIKYTIVPKHDDQKENNLKSLGTITINKGETETNVEVNVPAVFEKVVTDDFTITPDGNHVVIKANFDNVQRKIVSSDSINVENIDYNTDTLKTNFDVVQEKLYAGENILIEGNIIKAIGDANARYKQDKVLSSRDGAFIGNMFLGLTPEAKPTSNSIDRITKSGDYFLTGQSYAGTHMDTPNGKRGWLKVISALNSDNCLQIFVTWDGYGVWYRTGSRITLTMAAEQYDEGLSTTESEISDPTYWSPWRQILAINEEDTTLKSQYTNVKYNDAKWSTKSTATKTYSAHGIINNSQKRNITNTRTLAGSDGTVTASPLVLRPQMYLNYQGNQSIAHAYKRGTRLSYCLYKNSDGTMYIQVYDGQTQTGIQNIDLPNINGLTSDQRYAINQMADMEFSNDYLYVVTGCDWTLYQYSESLASTKTINLAGRFWENGLASSNGQLRTDTGSYRFITGVTTNPAAKLSDDEIVYIMTTDVKMTGHLTSDRGGYPTMNENDYICMWEYNVTTDTLTKKWSTPKWFNWAGGITYTSGYFYVTGALMGSTTYIADGVQSRVYNASGVTLDTINFITENDTDSQAMNNIRPWGTSVVQVPSVTNEYVDRTDTSWGGYDNLYDWVTVGLFRTNDTNLQARMPNYTSPQYNTSPYDERSDEPQKPVVG